MRLHIDFETRSRVDLKKVGAWAYAAHPSTEIMCMAWSRDGEPPRVTNQFVTAPTELLRALADPNTVIVAHNAHFEYAIYHEILVKRFGFLPIEDPMRWDCTLARAAMCNLPISLDYCGAALGISAKKDMAGRSAMLKLCRPGMDGKYNEDPELYRILYLYCQKDVEAEIEIDKRLPQMPASEKDIWNLDLVINKRGVLMDTKLACNAEMMVAGLTDDLNGKLHNLTGGAVSKASRIAEMKRFVEEHGVKVDSLDKATVSTLLSNVSTPEIVREVLNIRRQVGKTSTSKYTAIREVVSPEDGRARGLLQYHGAATGRWAGRLIQPHNFPKGVSKAKQKEIIDLILSGGGDGGLFSIMYGDEAMDALSSALRGTIIAPKGRTLVVADYSSIEPRVLFWLAGEIGALDMYRKGEDLYIDLARYIYKNDKLTKKDSTERAVGKMGILGCGYGMGKDRFQAQCAQFGLNITIDMAAMAVRAYRDKYARVKNMWYEVENAAKAAIRTPGSIHECCGGKVKFGMDAKREFLLCRLPSGRFLRYFRPSLKAGEYGDEIHYQGPGLGGALADQSTYGGSLVENITQAIARDIMANGMLNCEQAGFDTILTVHDEVVSECGKLLPVAEDAAVQLFVDAMCSLPAWAKGCPIAAEGWTGDRYRK